MKLPTKPQKTTTKKHKQVNKKTIKTCREKGSKKQTENIIKNYRKFLPTTQKMRYI